MKKLRKIILTSLGLTPFLLGIDPAVANETVSGDDLLTSAQELPWRKSRFSIEAQTGTRSIATLDAMVPFYGNDDFMIYANLMAKYGTGRYNGNGNTFEGNAGLGFRRVNDSESAIYGAYAFYDYLKSVNDNNFTQITVGVERLGLTWDFRANAYIPFGTTTVTKDDYKGGRIDVEGHDLIEYIKTNKETAQAGGDIEIGRTLGTNKLRGYFAVYSFGADLTGPRTRLEFQVTNNLSLNATVQYDKARETQYFLGMRYSIGGAKATNSNSIYARMTDTVVRDVDVVTKNINIDKTVVDNDRLWVVDYDKEQSGDGTLDNPFNSIEEAIAASGKDSVIVVKGSDGSIKRQYDALHLQEGQVLWGGDQDLYWDLSNRKPGIEGQEGSFLVQAGSGVRQNLGDNIYMASNSAIYHFDVGSDIVNGAKAGIVINDAQNVILDDVNFHGIHNETGSAVALEITGANSDVLLNNIDFKDVDVGINIDAASVSMDNINIENTTGNAIQLANHALLTAADINLSDIGQTGITLTEQSTLNASNIRLNNLGKHGLELDGSQLFADSIQINNTAYHGINTNESNIFVNQNLNITNTGSNALNTKGGQINVEQDLTIDTSKASGINAFGTFMHFGNVQISNIDWKAIQFKSADLIVDGFLNLESRLTALDLADANFFGGTANIMSIESFGIYQEGGDFTIDKFVVEQSEFAEGEAVTLLDVNKVTIGQGEIRNSQGVGLWQRGGELNVLDSLTITNAAKEGIILQTKQSNFNSLTIENSGNSGIWLMNGDFYADTLRVIGSGSTGLHIDTKAKVTINDAEISGSSYNGIYMLKGGELYSSGTIKVENNGSNGMYLKDVNAHLNHVEANQNSSRGLYISDSKVVIDASSNVANNESHGIEILGDSEVTLNDMNISKNEDHGIFLRNGKLIANNVMVSKNGHVNKTPQTLDDLTYGLKVQQDNTDIISQVIWTGGGFANNINHGVVINGGDEHKFSYFTSNNNEDGFLLTAGSVVLDHADIFQNRRFGIYVKNYYYDIFGAERKLDVIHSEIYENKNTYPDMNANYGSGHGIAIDHDATVNILSTDIHDNDGDGMYVKAGDIYIGATAEDLANGVEYASFLRNNLKGGLRAQASSADYRRELSVTMEDTAVSNNLLVGLSLIFMNKFHLNRVKITDNERGIEAVVGTSGLIENTIIADNRASSWIYSDIELGDGNQFDDEIKRG